MSFSTATSDAYRSTMPLNGVPVLIDGVPIGSDADGYRFRDGWRRTTSSPVSGSRTVSSATRTRRWGSSRVVSPSKRRS